MKASFAISSFFLMNLLFTSVFGQTIPEFNMSNFTTRECKGILKDSEELAGGSTYGHNENFTFVIATGGKITMTFSPVFCTEMGIDTLRFFDGPNVLSPKIGGTYSGNIPPPVIVANSGYLTINFKSDNNVAYCGWEAEWRSEHVEPVPPIMTVNPIPMCNSPIITVTYSKKVACANVLPTDFTITGPLPLFVTSVTSPSCSGPSDSTTQFNLGLSQPIDVNCDYKIDMDIGIADNCDSIWNFVLTDSFQLVTCPFNVEIVATEDTVCPGTCTEIEAIITGTPGNCLNFNYTWSHGLPNSPGPHLVCPSANTNYTVSVQQVGGGPIVNANKLIRHVDPNIVSPVAPIIVCQSDAAFPFTATPSGGSFAGTGITDPITGLFDPDIAGGGNHFVYYNMTNLCYDSTLVTVKAIDAGLNEAACPGTTPFAVSGFSPPGGTWSGDSITTAGIFNPENSGTFNITYSVNGCMESKKIFVDSITLVTLIDTVCESTGSINIQIMPPGGIWSGPGITDPVNGIFDPAIAGPGNKSLTYSTSGCNFSIDVFVKDVDAGNNETRCPLEPAFIISPPGSPAGGTWSGLGIVNATTGLFNPLFAFGGANGNAILNYTAPNGCTDQKTIFLRRTSIRDDSVFFCTDDPQFILNATTVGRTPGGGAWTGTAVTRSGGNYYFHPSVAGVGIHKLTYTTNSCYDTIKMVVHPTSINFPDTLVCSTHPPFLIEQFPAGGKWVGAGVNSKTGIFDPSKAPIGTHYIRYQSPVNCVRDTVIITIYPFIAAKISGIDSVLCFKDSSFSISVTPANGKLTGPGISNGKFNPAVAGEGQHEINYTFGKGPCQTSDNMFIVVLPSLQTQVSVSDEEVCLGESSTITLTPSGGLADVNHQYTWSHGLFPQQSNPVIPTTTTTYVIVTSDGCSNDVTDSVTIKVAENFGRSIKTNEKLCFGEQGYAKVEVLGSSTYNISWQGPENKSGDSISGNAGDLYQVTITDISTNCTSDTLIKIPSFGSVKAKFLVNPNFDCIPTDRKDVAFIDVSNNAVTGTWEFGTGDMIAYVPGSNPQYQFEDAGHYDVTLTIQNEGGCEDSYTETLCVEDIRPIFVADAFSPNGDGNNDVLHVKAKGIKELTFLIYSRQGLKVFESSSLENGWDGKFNGKDMTTGVYIYVVSAKLIDNQVVTRKGNVTLIR